MDEPSARRHEPSRGARRTVPTTTGPISSGVDRSVAALARAGQHEVAAAARRTRTDPAIHD